MQILLVLQCFCLSVHEWLYSLLQAWSQSDINSSTYTYYISFACMCVFLNERCCTKIVTSRNVLLYYIILIMWQNISSLIVVYKVTRSSHDNWVDLITPAVFVTYLTIWSPTVQYVIGWHYYIVIPTWSLIMEARLQKNHFGV